jgi:hypothetical protein
LGIHNVKDVPIDVFFEEEEDIGAPASVGIGPGGIFERDPAFCVVGAEKIAGLITRIRIDEARSGGHCMCTGGQWLRFYRRGEEIASFTGHHGVALRWEAGPWPGDGALTEEAAAAIPAWFLAEGFPLLQQAREAAIARAQRATEEWERFLADLPPEIRAEVLGDPIRE